MFNSTGIVRIVTVVIITIIGLLIPFTVQAESEPKIFNDFMIEPGLISIGSSLNLTWKRNITVTNLSSHSSSFFVGLREPDTLVKEEYKPYNLSLDNIQIKGQEKFSISALTSVEVPIWINTVRLGTEKLEAWVSVTEDKPLYRGEMVTKIRISRAELSTGYEIRYDSTSAEPTYFVTKGYMIGGVLISFGVILIAISGVLITIRYKRSRKPLLLQKGGEENEEKKY